MAGNQIDPLTEGILSLDEPWRGRFLALLALRAHEKGQTGILNHVSTSPSGYTMQTSIRNSSFCWMNGTRWCYEQSGPLPRSGRLSRASRDHLVQQEHHE